jgi:hypothetical protein
MRTLPQLVEDLTEISNGLFEAESPWVSDLDAVILELREISDSIYPRVKP